MFKDCKKLTNINMIDDSCYSFKNGIVFNKEMDRIEFIGEGVKELTLPDTIKETTISSKIKKLIINFAVNTETNIEIETTSIDDIVFIVDGKTYSFNLEQEKYSLEKYGYHYCIKELYPQKKEQVLKLLNRIISIMMSGNIKDNDLGESIYAGWSGSVEIIEPMLNLRISLSEAVADIYGVDKFDFFDKLFEPVITQDNDFDVSNNLHNEVIRYFADNLDLIVYIKHFSELKSEIEKGIK